MRADLPSGTVTFLFSDIERSTRLLRQLGTKAYGELLTQHNRVLHDALDEAGGVEIDRQGDSIFAVFPSGGAAVAAAIAAQRALGGQTWPEGAAVRVRMGLHTGEAGRSDEGYIGLAVHKAARIGDAGHGGQVLLSATTAALVEHELPEGVGLRDLGEAALEGLERPERLFQLEIEGLPAEFPPLSAPRARGSGPVLLEREAELAAVTALVHAAFDGTGRLVAIEGRAGLGKTRLLTEVRSVAATIGMDVLVARGGELEAELSYGVVRQLFEPALAAAGPDGRAELLSGAAALASALFDERRLAEALGGGAADTSFATLHGLFWLTGNLAARRPLLLAIDDLHWCDAPSLRWLLYLSRRLEGLPLLVVAATRPPEQATEELLLTEFVSDPATVSIQLAALSAASAAALVRGALGSDADEEFCAACHVATGGNPLLLSALLDTLAADRVPPTRASVPHVRAAGPEALVRSVGLRLARLPDEARQLARAVSVLGDDVDLREAAAVADLEPELASHFATSLARADLLRLERPLGFVHPVVRQAVYSELSPLERQAMHARAARLLAESRGPAERAAAHVLLVEPAGDAWAVDVLRRAASRSRASGAPDVAAGYLRRALLEPPTEDARAEVLYELGLAEVLVHGPLAVEHLRQALDALRTPGLIARAALELGRALTFTQRPAQAMDVLESARAAVDGDEPEMRGVLDAAILHTGMSEPSLYPRVRDRLRKLAEQGVGDGPEARALSASLALYEARLGSDRAAAVRHARAALEGRALVRDEEAPFYLIAGLTLTIADEFESADEIWNQAIEGARSRGSIFGFAAGSCFRAYNAFCRGALADAEADARASVDAALSHGLDAGVPAAFLALVLLERGDVEGAAAALDRTPFGEEIPDTNHLYFLLQARGLVRARQGRHAAALGDLRELGRRHGSLDGSNPASFAWRSDAALILLEGGEEDEARKLASEEVRLARAWGAPRALGKALRAAGLAAGGDRGLSWLREATEVLEPSQARLEHAYALTELGAALRRRNRRSDARDPLRRGLDLAHSCGATVLAERAHAELAATGTRPRRIALSGVDALTPSEQRVAAMAAEGMTNRDIAQALFVTPKTIEVHLSSVYRKLGISSRSQLDRALATVE